MRKKYLFVGGPLQFSLGGGNFPPLTNASEADRWLASNPWRPGNSADHMDLSYESEDDE
jgi:hypothetical protein